MGRFANASTRDKVLAISAAGIVLAVGTTVTVAAWNDEEWVFGGNAGTPGEPGIGTSIFEVQQDASNPYVAPGTWADFEENPGDGLLFTPVEALSLTPGETIYAPVALTTTEDSLGGTLELQAAVAAAGIVVNDPEGSLWDALVVSVRAIEKASTADAPPACSAAGFADYTSAILTNTDETPGLDAGDPVAGPDLAAERGNVVHYCFEITLPTTVAGDGNLMGLTVAPAWQFIGTSVEP